MEMLNIDTIKKYKVVGIRGLTRDENYKVGDICRPSYQWDYENDMSTYDTEEPEELSGTCATNTGIDTFYDDDAEILEKINNTISDFNYIGKRALIAGDDYSYGMDENEVIIEDARVLHIF